MKYILSILLFFVVCSNSYAQKDIIPGMSMDEFNTIKPGIIPEDVKFSRNFKIEEEKYGLKGAWFIQFRNNVISSVNYGYRDRLGFVSEPNDKVNRKTFEKLFVSYEMILDEYKKVYGTPDIYTERDTLYKKVDHQTRTDTIIYTTWDIGNSRIELSFNIWGIDESQYYIPNSEPTSFYYGLHINHIPTKKTNDKKIKEKYFLGKHVNEFSKDHPELFPEGISMDGQWSEEAEYYGLKDEWTYFFREGKLESYAISFYSEREGISADEFDRFLKAADQWVNSYKKEYGEPNEYVSENREFKDPYKEHHWGYQVLQSVWKLDDRTITVEFDFHGGKGEYFFVLEILIGKTEE